jgi:hypothetical protein
MCLKPGSLILREEKRLRVFENRVLREIFGLKGEEVKGHRVMRRFMIATPLKVLFG